MIQRRAVLVCDGEGCKRRFDVLERDGKYEPESSNAITRRLLAAWKIEGDKVLCDKCQEPEEAG